MGKKFSEDSVAGGGVVALNRKNHKVVFCRKEILVPFEGLVYCVWKVNVFGEAAVLTLLNFSL